MQATGSCVNHGAGYGMEFLALIDYMDLRDISEEFRNVCNLCQTLDLSA